MPQHLHASRDDHTELYFVMGCSLTTFISIACWLMVGALLCSFLMLHMPVSSLLLLEGFQMLLK
jgi:hypothetical protein